MSIVKNPITYLIILILTVVFLVWFMPDESGIWALLGSAATALLSYFIQVARENYQDTKRRQVVAAAIAGEVQSLLLIIERREYVKVLENLIAYINAGGIMDSSDFMSVSTDAFFDSPRAICLGNQTCRRVVYSVFDRRQVVSLLPK